MYLDKQNNQSLDHNSTKRLALTFLLGHPHTAQTQHKPVPWQMLDTTGKRIETDFLTVKKHVASPIIIFISDVACFASRGFTSPSSFSKRRFAIETACSFAACGSSPCAVSPPLHCYTRPDQQAKLPTTHPGSSHDGLARAPSSPLRACMRSPLPLHVLAPTTLC